MPVFSQPYTISCSAGQLGLVATVGGNPIGGPHLIIDHAMAPVFNFLPALHCTLEALRPNDESTNHTVIEVTREHDLLELRFNLDLNYYLAEDSADYQLVKDLLNLVGLMFFAEYAPETFIVELEDSIKSTRRALYERLFAQRNAGFAVDSNGGVSSMGLRAALEVLRDGSIMVEVIGLPVGSENNMIAVIADLMSPGGQERFQRNPFGGIMNLFGGGVIKA